MRFDAFFVSLSVGVGVGVVFFYRTKRLQKQAQKKNEKNETLKMKDPLFYPIWPYPLKPPFLLLGRFLSFRFVKVSHYCYQKPSSFETLVKHTHIFPTVLRKKNFCVNC